MPRRPRIHIPGMPVHVIQRGHNRNACFFSHADYLIYRNWLGEALHKTGCLLHAYVLMSNHVHLLLTPPAEDSVAQLTISLGRRYVQYINKHYDRIGTLWQGRYKSSLVTTDDYFLSCQRYIELNPVRAALTDDPAYYRWSSYWANGLGQPDPLVTPHQIYLGLANNEPERLAAYRALFNIALNDKVVDDIRIAINQGHPLGREGFLDEIAKSTATPRHIKPRGRPHK